MSTQTPAKSAAAPSEIGNIGATCLCFFAQRAARTLARHFDEVFRPLGITNGQFSMMNALNRPEPPSIAQVADMLSMDRTTLTAALKPLRRRGLVEVAVDPADKRTRRLRLTKAGGELLARARVLWKSAHDEVERELVPADPDELRADLRRIFEALGEAH